MSAATHVTQLRGRLHHRKATVDGYTFHYYEGGSGDTLVLLHTVSSASSALSGSTLAVTPWAATSRPPTPCGIQTVSPA